MTVIGGLRTRVMIVVALAAIVPTLIVGALAVRRARRDVEREVVRGNLALVRALGAGLDATLQEARRTLTLVGGAWADTRGDAKRRDPSDPASGRDTRGDAKRWDPSDQRAGDDGTRRLLARLKRELPVVRRVGILDADGRPAGGDAIAPAAIERHSTYGSYVSDVVFADGAARVLVVAQARGRTGELQGFVIAELDLGFVGEALASARLGRGARLWVVDADGRPVASSDPTATPGGESLRGTSPAVDLALAASDEGSVEAAGRLAVYRNLASYQTTRGVSWAIVLEQPTRDAYALAAATQRDTVIAGSLVLMAALLCGWLLARRLTGPLARLTARVDAVASGAPAPAGELSAPGEIGILARRFEEMAARVAERERLQAELARSAKLASVGALAAGVAHEVNNPLTTILGYATLLLENRPAGDPDREALELVADEARRVQVIVRTLLDYARAETGPLQREPLEVNALVERTVALLQPTLRERQVVLDVQLGADLPRPAGDARRLEQVFVNLGQNAAHAMEGGGRLAIRTAVSAAGVVVEFTDSGPGIPEETLGRIFEPFFTTKGPGVGTGLGLAISQQIVLDHGGRIEVESRIGRGSTFRVLLG